MRVNGLFAVVLATAAAGRGQAYELRGRVVDEAFGPLAGAALAAGRSSALETTAVLAAPMATSAADGSFRLRLEPARDIAAVLVTAPGRLGLCLEVGSLREAPPGVLDVGDLPLPPGTLRIGRVVDAAGAPIAGARLEVLDAIGSGEAFPGEPERKARYAVFARSDDRGVFRLPGVAPGMRAEVSADGYATRQIAHLAASTPTTIELLATGRSPAGVEPEASDKTGGARRVPVRARDAVSGAPIVEFRAAVVWVSVQGPWFRLCEALATGGEQANDDGAAMLRFPVPDMPPLLRPYIGVLAPGYAMAMTGDVNDPVVALERGAVVAGTVRDAATAAPLSGVQVWAVPLMRQGEPSHNDGTDALGQPPGAVRTGDDGAFRLEGLRPGELIVHARHPARPARHRKVTARAGETLAVDCAIDTGCALRVVARSAIAPGTAVRLAPSTARARGELPELSGLPDRHLSYQRGFTNGVAVFEGLPADHYRVALRLPVAPRGGAPVELALAEVDLGPTPAVLEVGDLDAANVRGRLTVHGADLTPDHLLVTSIAPAQRSTSLAAAAGWRAFVSASGDFDLRVAPCALRLCVIDLRTQLLVHVSDVIQVEDTVMQDLDVRPATLIVRPASNAPVPHEGLRLWTQRTSLLDQERVAWSRHAASGSVILPLEPGGSEWRLLVAPGPILLKVFAADPGASFGRPRPRLFEASPGQTTVLELPVQSG